MRTMRVLRPWGSFSFVALALLLAATQYVGTGRGSPSTEPLQVEEGKEAFGQACVQCHNMSRTQMQRKTADGWRDTVYSMISRGAPVMPDEIEPLIDYLAVTYGPGATPHPRRKAQSLPPPNSSKSNGGALRLLLRCP